MLSLGYYNLNQAAVAQMGQDASQVTFYSLVM